MSFFSDLLHSLFGTHKSTPATPTRAVAVTVFDNAGHPVANAHVVLDSIGTKLMGLTNTNGYTVFPIVPDTPVLVQSHVWVTADKCEDYASHVDLGAGNFTVRIGEATVGHDVTLPAIKRKMTARTGVVRAVGHNYVDDDGVFYPLGATLFWALRGWKFERERVKQNIQWLATFKYDYIRILGEVNWPGNDISPDAWGAEYDTLLGELIDFTYDECGMRVQLTMIGGGTANWGALASRIAAVINANRQHKIQFIEVANEWWQNFKDEENMKGLGRTFKSSTPCLVALSAPQEEGATEKTKTWVAAGAASCGTAHFDRNAGENHWRHVRKPWESRSPQFPSSSNEPGGPRSSVAEYTEPIHLIMSRAVAILCGFDSYVLHNGAGVAGQIDPAHNRPANLWEVPGIDIIMNKVRALDAMLPSNASNGICTRTGLAGHPLSSDAFWPDGGDHGVVRDYALVQGDSFWQVLLGIKDHVSLKASNNYDFTVTDPVTGFTGETYHIRAGQSMSFGPTSRDTTGLGALILKGRRV
jgi:hypothetical protein